MLSLEQRLRNPESWIHIPGLALTSMILGKLPKLSVPWFFICKMGMIIIISPPNRDVVSIRWTHINHTEGTICA